MEKSYTKKVLVIGVLFLFLGASATLGASARAWMDNFDSYTLGQFLDGGLDDGGWKGWDNVPGAGAYVTNAQSYSSPHSVDITGATDLVHEYEGYTTGQWIYKCMQYIPVDYNGNEYFIILSSYTDGAGDNNKWALLIRFDAANEYVESEQDYLTLPLITGEWVELRTEIDLDTDWFEFYYGGTLLVEKEWTACWNNAYDGFLVIDAVDLYAQSSTTSIYYDDFSLIPAGDELSCGAGGPYSGEVGEDVHFTGSAFGGTEPYTWAWDFGDGNTSDVQNPTHAYEAAGVYNVTLTVTDAMSDTATDETTATIIAPAPEIEIGTITGGLFKVKAVIKNTGDADATDVDWSITLDGGLIILGKETTGTETTIAAGGQVEVTSSLILGLGKTTITVTADTATKDQAATVLLIFIKI
jgi:hypothetical protein